MFVLCSEQTPPYRDDKRVFVARLKEKQKKKLIFVKKTKTNPACVFQNANRIFLNSAYDIEERRGRENKCFLKTLIGRL